MVEEGTVRRLLRVIEKRLARLEKLVGTPLEAYLADMDLQDVVERNLELVIQACLDLGIHVLADRASAPPETHRAVFRLLVDEGVVDPELGGRLEAMAGFRNRLVHEYADLLPEKVHGYLAELDDVRRYVREVVDHLTAEGLFGGADRSEPGNSPR
ncbi:type VII toxin-antitoxin system HepT family RNase toxin [Limnochorda pilosa]|uniref:DUF86 domain-containing protein n=1 Tax=Limnochorda pilosa TaxID=1555112 RepID=A0A0K2SJX1_LIMPI|nr:DUF86 domain-containing protein [Limnochorda pilosa]BAS27411.1 hypothetical protein LIP_1564 [Limnochorda pilosa]